jgi:GNAT superfamily N-acetyltransferase
VSALRAPTFRIERLARHDRSAFGCGVPALDRYFRGQAGQDVRRRVASCFVAVADEDDGAVRGFYTLAPASVALGDLPADLARRLPRYPSVPAYRVGRLAVDRAARGHGLGAALLADALLRAGRAEAAGYALVVDAKDETAAAFYRHHGFLELAGRPLALFLPLATVGKVGE